MSHSKSKHILITGASSGIGQQLAEDYIQEGHHVYVCGRNKELLENLFGSKANIVCFDMTIEAEARRALNGISGLDLIILNAGTCEYIDDVKHFDAQLFHRVVNTNLNGTVNCLAALLPNLKQGSHLAIISSSVTYLPFSRAEAYGASKAAIDYLARSLSIDLSPYNILVSIIRPGFVDTALTQKNDFAMPGLISVEKASRYIRSGLAKKKKNINFPRLFIFVMRLFSTMPNVIWEKLAITMAKK